MPTTETRDELMVSAFAGGEEPSAAVRRALWLRTVVLAALSVAALGVLVILAYELALARVPQHRAALERLVRAHTGLDVRFNELGLRWGWYGPEAVFRRVELGEPGRSNVLLRAPQLIVGFDAWRTLQSGQLQAGRITLVAPEIDLFRSSPAVHAADAAGRTAVDHARILQRWRGGRIEVQGGTLRLPDPSGAARPFTLQLRSVSLRRSDDRWNAHALLFLPERLGRTARVIAQVQGDISRPDSLTGTLRLEGFRLLFAGWHELAGPSRAFVAYLPRTGAGDLDLRASFAEGRIDKADGKIDAENVSFAPRPHTAPPATQGGTVLRLDQLAGDWKVARRGADWLLQVRELALGSRDQPRATLDVELADGGKHVRGTLDRAELGPLVAVARWLSPHLELAGARVSGTSRDLTFDWNEQRADGERLQARADLDDVTVSAPSGSFSLAGLDILLSGSERELTAEIGSSQARLALTQGSERVLEPLVVASVLLVRQTDDGWQLASEQIQVERDEARLTLSGELSGASGREDVVIGARGTLSGADVPMLKQVFGPAAAQGPGEMLERVSAGRIEDARFELKGSLDELPLGRDGEAFSGSLALHEATVTGGEAWPDLTAMDAQLEWNGEHVRATIERGQAGPFDLSSAQAEWQAGGSGAGRMSGQLVGRLADAVTWVEEHPALQEHVAHLQTLAAEGDAVFDFDVVLPPQVAASAPDVQRVRSRVNATLEDAQFRLSPELPPVENVRGALVFEDGRLERSTLTASWLGGPMTLRVAADSDREASTLEVRAQGVLDARQLAALASLDELAEVSGETEWTAEFSYTPAGELLPSQWRLRADSSLLGVASELPEPLKKSSETATALHVEVSGTTEGADLHVNLGQRLRTAFALRSEDGWRVQRGAVQLGAEAAELPDEAVISVRGTLNRLDLPAYVSAWQRIRREPTELVLMADLTAREMYVAGRRYTDVRLHAGRGEDGAQLTLESGALAGTVRWPAGSAEMGVAEVQLARLDVPDAAMPANISDLLASVGSGARVAVEELSWHGLPLGQFSAQIESREAGWVFDDLRLQDGAHDARGQLRCGTDLAQCHLSFVLESRDAAATLRDFGFRDDVTAAQASISGELDWPAGDETPWLAALSGNVSLQLRDGIARTTATQEARPFGLLTVPALVSGMAQPPLKEGAQQDGAPRELAFRRLEADFELRDGQAFTSNLHFDGDAEILMRGRTGLVAHDYDHEVWVLRGEDRLPAAVRRFGATPRVAAAWMTLRELLGSADADRSRAMLRLQGSWSEPIVAAEP